MLVVEGAEVITTACVGTVTGGKLRAATAGKHSVWRTAGCMGRWWRLWAGNLGTKVAARAERL